MLGQTSAAGYVRLRAAAPVGPPPIAPPPEDVAGAVGWARLLEWCVVEVGCEVAILTDDQGLAIASAGVMDVDAADGIAARMVIVFHQADRLVGRPARTVVIQLDRDRWLTGLRVDHVDGPLALSLLMDGPLAAGTRAAIVAALADKARG